MAFCRRACSGAPAQREDRKEDLQPQTAGLKSPLELLSEQGSPVGPRWVDFEGLWIDNFDVLMAPVQGWTGDPICAPKEMFYLPGVVRGLASGVIGKPDCAGSYVSARLRRRSDRFDPISDPIPDLVVRLALICLQLFLGSTKQKKPRADLSLIASTKSDFEVWDFEFCVLFGNAKFSFGHSVDEHIYHEMARRPPRSVFLGGSGDGAGPRELLRWQSLEKVTMVDIDYEVTRFALEWVPGFAGRSFEDPRLQLTTGDALAFLQQLPKGQTFDILILDFPDAFDSKELEKLYSTEFYELCRSHMHDQSILVTQSGPCVEVTRAGTRAKCWLLQEMILPNLTAVFPQVEVLLHPMATWKAEIKTPSEWSSFSLARLGEDALAHDFDMPPEIPSLRYYTAERHRAALDHPQPLKKRLRERTPRSEL
ncbi:Spermidine synthase [Symbiodinium microadriaticum]|uniref:Spermidine synthase n=1 Tax=Symbiodinium microadriaticum TaxID=2951 RepID=A0A1Q9EXW9_SYMMI|nr:Spermidine synthase [Symbiodinium microadriaticum]